MLSTEQSGSGVYTNPRCEIVISQTLSQSSATHNPLSMLDTGRQGFHSQSEPHLCHPDSSVSECCHEWAVHVGQAHQSPGDVGCVLGQKLVQALLQDVFSNL